MLTISEHVDPIQANHELRIDVHGAVGATWSRLACVLGHRWEERRTLLGAPGSRAPASAKLLRIRSFGDDCDEVSWQLWTECGRCGQVSDAVFASKRWARHRSH